MWRGAVVDRSPFVSLARADYGPLTRGIGIPALAGSASWGAGAYRVMATYWSLCTRVLEIGEIGCIVPYMSTLPHIADATEAAHRRYQAIQRDHTVMLYEVKPNGGLVFGLKHSSGHWQTFAINPDGGRAYPLGL